MYNDFTADVMRALGISRLPVEGIEPRTVLGGIRVWVTALVMPNPTRWKRSVHRLMCACPLCDWTGSVGRINQHKCKHPETHCWACGTLLSRVTDEPYKYGGHSFCDSHCMHRSDDEPQDFDAQDRNAAASERIEIQRNER